MKHPVIDYYLSDDYDLMKSKGEFSCLMLALRDARLVSGRNDKTGEVINFSGPNSPHNWSAAILYLIILEQIGACLKLKEIELPKEKPNPIFWALTNFSTQKLFDSEYHAIAALRHSFAHNYGLVNDHKNKEHVFRLIANQIEPLITIPNERNRWDGIYPIENSHSVTKINIWKLGDLVEEIVWNVRKEYTEDNIELRISEDELKYKYITAMI